MYPFLFTSSAAKAWKIFFTFNPVLALHKYNTNLTENQIQESDTCSTTVQDSESKEHYPTYSVVGLEHPVDHTGQSLAIETSENDQVLKLVRETDDDRASVGSTDSASPLLL